MDDEFHCLTELQFGSIDDHSGLLTSGSWLHDCPFVPCKNHLANRCMYWSALSVGTKTPLP